MSSLRKLAIIIIIFLCSVLSTGCGDQNIEVPSYDYESDEGHPEGWLPTGHSVEASENVGRCSECHGKIFGGGSSDVACTSCHLGSETDVHPLQWDGFDALRHSSFVEQQDTAACSNIYCHGANLSGVQDSGPSCLTACHMGSETDSHPLQWGNLDALRHGDHVVQQGSAACSNVYCHGANLSGVQDSGPSCLTACHMGNSGTVHLVSWGVYTYAMHDTYVRQNGATQCSNVSCHGADLRGVIGSGPYCSECHMGDTVVDGAIIFSVHPAGWDADPVLHGYYVSLNGTAYCSNLTCHGSFLQGVTGSGTSCYACH